MIGFIGIFLFVQNVFLLFLGQTGKKGPKYFFPVYHEFICKKYFVEGTKNKYCGANLFKKPGHRTYGIRRGFSFAGETSFRNVFIEGDSRQVIKALQILQTPFPHGESLLEMQIILLGFWVGRSLSKPTEKLTRSPYVSTECSRLYC